MSNIRADQSSCCQSIISTDVSQLAQTPCSTCLGTGTTGARDECTVAFIQNIGVTIGVSGNIVSLTAPNGIYFDTQRVNNAVDQANSQFPTGSFRGYINSVFGNIGSSLATNARDAFGIILASIVIGMFLLYAIICIILIAAGILDLATAIAILLIGLIISILIFIISLIEANKFSSNIENSFSSESVSLVDNVYCAFLSGLCCYSGRTCCCPNGSDTVCKNPPFPPSP